MNSKSTSSFFQLVKTAKPIEAITELVSDRLIVTKSGELYFDYSDKLRLKLTNNNDNVPIVSFYSGSFSNKKLYDNEIIYYSNLNGINNEPISSLTNNSLVFDRNGNYAVVIGTFDDLSKCNCKIIGLVNNIETSPGNGSLPDELKTVLTGNFIIATEANVVSINFDELDLTNSTLKQKVIKLKSSNDSINLSSNNDEIDLSINENKLPFSKILGPYSSINEISENDLSSKHLYLISNESMFSLYMYINETLQCISKGSTDNLETTYNKLEIDAKLQDVHDRIDELENSMTIERIEDRISVETITY